MLCVNSNSVNKMQDSETHFDNIAKEYDFWKDRNKYYYQNLIKLYRSHIPSASSVLEIGCGTGDILSKLETKEGKGIDLSREMIEIARRKHQENKNLVFEREDIFDSNATFPYEYIFLADVLEHVHDLPRFLDQLTRRTSPRSQIVISLANPFWEPLLMLAEKFRMKMPEGPHHRYSISEMENMFRNNGLYIKKKGYKLLIPKNIIGADWVNARFSNNKILEKFGFVVYWVLSRSNE